MKIIQHKKAKIYVYENEKLHILGWMVMNI